MPLIEGISSYDASSLSFLDPSSPQTLQDVNGSLMDDVQGGRGSLMESAAFMRCAGDEFMHRNRGRGGSLVAMRKK